MNSSHDMIVDAASGEARSPATIDGRPVVVGEVLFDSFPDGSRVLGGAPFNVAWHLQAFGLQPLVLTRIGDDTLGEEVLEAMAGWGMDCSGVQLDRDAPTGRVRVELDRGAPSFDILPDQAYDRLELDAALRAVSDPGPALLYHGTLIARGETGRTAIRGVREQCRAPVFVDVNLRDPWWEGRVVASLVRNVQWVKLNDDELGRLTGDGAATTETELEGAAAALAARHELAQVVVTCGGRGAFVWTDRRWIAGRPPLAVEVVDTVGAGDAFSAVWIAGSLGGWPPETTLVRALEFAAAVCTIRGATTADRRLHDRHLEVWEKA